MSGKYNYRRMGIRLVFSAGISWILRNPRRVDVPTGRNLEKGRAYFFCVGGAAGTGAGVAGCVLTGCDLTPCNTDAGPPRFETSTDNVMEVIMNATADHVVARESALAAPRGPNAVWLP